MPNNISRYDLDRTGRHPDNLVVNESRTLRPTTNRIIVPTGGSFFTKSFVLRDSTGTVLELGRQYRFANFNEAATIDLQQEVADTVLVIDRNVSATVYYDYQVVGGLYGFSKQALITQIERLGLDRRKVEYGNIIHKPTSFPPHRHLHSLADVYGWQYVVQTLESIRQAILIGDAASHDAIYTYVDNIDTKLKGLIDAISDSVDDHAARRDNPHGVTAAQVGTYNKAELDAKFKTLTDSGNAHAARRDNPHQVTAEQVNTYNKATIDNKIKVLQDSVKPLLETHTKDKNNPHQVTASQVGAYTKAEVEAKLTNLTNSFDAFKNRRDNPHVVTASQVGAYTKQEADTKLMDKLLELLVDSVVVGGRNVYKLQESVIPISTAAHNMLKWNKDGLYYGTTPDASTANLYVDAVNGEDIKPTIENKAGTRAKPLRTIKFAVEAGGIGNDRVVYLMENQEHIIDCSLNNAGVVFINSSRVDFRPYGPLSDATPDTPTGSRYYNPAILNTNTKIIFTGYYISRTGSGAAFTSSCIAFQGSGKSTLDFTGVHLVRRELDPTKLVLPSDPVQLPGMIQATKPNMTSGQGIISPWSPVDVYVRNCKVDTGVRYTYGDDTNFDKPFFQALGTAPSFNLYIDGLLPENITGDNSLFNLVSILTTQLQFISTTGWTFDYLLSKSKEKRLLDDGTFMHFKCNIRKILTLQERIPISAKDDNLIRWEEGGLYYGLKAPASTANLYVDATNGRDIVPTVENRRGTRELPLKTIRFALEQGTSGTTRTIFLKEHQAHRISAGNGETLPDSVYEGAGFPWTLIPGGKVNFFPYGDRVDALPSFNGNNKWHNPNLIDTADCRIVFGGWSFYKVDSTKYISMTSLVPDLPVNLRFHGIKIIREIPNNNIPNKDNYNYNFVSPILPTNDIDYMFLNCLIATGSEFHYRGGMHELPFFQGLSWAGKTNIVFNDCLRGNITGVQPLFSSNDKSNYSISDQSCPDFNFDFIRSRCYSTTRDFNFAGELKYYTYNRANNGTVTVSNTSPPGPENYPEGHIWISV